jgi:hypothetical protein
MWKRVGHRWEMALARPLPACLLDSDAQRTCSGTSGEWTNQVLLSRRPDEVGTRVLPIFEPFGLSSRSCCSTGRLTPSRDEKPIPLGGGGGRSEASPFFHRENTVHGSNFSPGWVGPGPGPGKRRRRQGSTSTPGTRTQFAINRILGVSAD